MLSSHGCVRGIAELFEDMENMQGTAEGYVFLDWEQMSKLVLA